MNMGRSYDIIQERWEVMVNATLLLELKPRFTLEVYQSWVDMIWKINNCQFILWGDTSRQPIPIYLLKDWGKQCLVNWDGMACMGISFHTVLYRFISFYYIQHLPSWAVSGDVYFVGSVLLPFLTDSFIGGLPWQPSFFHQQTGGTRTSIWPIS